ncbi:uncharacterized protein N7496_006223 [Penicillium cataractarum]|uniref:Uncharacterized protein n=2 Tax=Penicillium TaxID=5073 RepID=A0A0F7TEQ8_PENBI|nr:uncharacterized protein N7496_006223 [Penicillium cataractarum]KAJ5370131.1 hypothetical protein N7496_006223 [Penicillium cataractarum]CEJ54945.1 hypothetical protein PMG11_01231 [Penicillium brasilianum]
MSAPVETLDASWKKALTSDVAVLKLASSEGNVGFLSIFSEKTLMNLQAETSSLRQDLMAMDINTMYNNSDIYQRLSQKTTEGLQQTQDEAERVKRSLEEKANGPDAKDEGSWKDQLRKTVEEQKKNSEKRWDDFLTLGLAEIEKLPPTMRPGAATTYSAGLSAIGAFAGKIVDTLKGFVSRISEFVSKAWEKIKEFGQSVYNWASGAWNSVKGIYGSIFSVQGLSTQSLVAQSTLSPPNSNGELGPRTLRKVLSNVALNGAGDSETVMVPAGLLRSLAEFLW